MGHLRKIKRACRHRSPGSARPPSDDGVEYIDLDRRELEGILEHAKTAPMSQDEYDTRAGTVCLDEPLRLALCARLALCVEIIERSRCAHRDLSCGNVFIDLASLEIYLIDFDSFYHPSLAMPQATTCGTAGYTPHLAWNGRNLDAERTWCECADRYALSLINTEFLLMSPGTNATNEGGIFDQEELRQQSGKGLDSIFTELKAKYPRAAELLKATIQSPSFSDCPSPQDWAKLVPGTTVKAPSLDDLPDIPYDLLDRLVRYRPAAPLWPAPSLNDMPTPQISRKLTIAPRTVILPSDPWSTTTGKITSAGANENSCRPVRR